MIEGIDHVVLVVRDLDRSIAFYRDRLGLTPREERPGKWSLQAGGAKISLQTVEGRPEIAAQTTPGSANICFIGDVDVDALAASLKADGLQILTGPSTKDGATGPIWSIHFRDPDGNLVEVARPN